MVTPIVHVPYGSCMSIPFDLWGQRGYPHADIAGESHHAAAIRGLFGDDFKPDGTEITVTGTLEPEPTNRHDRNAVAVRAGGALLGYLPRDDAAQYAPVLSALTASGWSPQVTARVWGSEWGDYDDRRTTFHGSIRLDLAEPHMLVPANMPPSGEHRVLPTGNAIQVTGEEAHLDVLVPFLRPEGECWAYATLHETVEQTTRSSRTVVEVRLDGARVGQLTPKMSGDVLPAVRHLAENGATTAARAVVKGNRIKSEVVLYVARAHELPDSWLGATAAPRSPPPATVATPTAEPPATPARPTEHAEIPTPPTGIRFAVPRTAATRGDGHRSPDGGRSRVGAGAGGLAVVGSWMGLIRRCTPWAAAPFRDIGPWITALTFYLKLAVGRWSPT
jgi:collagen type III alpha